MSASPPLPGETAWSRRRPALIEAGAVFALLVVLVVIAALSMGDLVDGRRFDLIAAQLGTDVQFARNQAVARHQALRLSVYAKSDGDCYVIHSGPSRLCDCLSATDKRPARCTGGAAEIKTVRLPAVHRVALTASVAYLGFEPDRGAASPAGTLCLAGPNDRRVNKVVAPLGRVRSCVPSSTASACGPCLGAS
jgi:Tfp pilus assembly protein FimT